MKIKQEDAPPAASDAALEKVATLAQWQVLGLGNVDSTLMLVAPHRVYNLRRRGLADRNNTTDLRQAADAGGWRFLVATDGRVLAAVQTWEEAGRWKVSSVRTGSWATGTRKALEGVDSDGEARLAYLWCRTTWSAALWLRAADPAADKVVPLPWFRNRQWAGLDSVAPADYLKTMQHYYWTQPWMLGQ